MDPITSRLAVAAAVVGAALTAAGCAAGAASPASTKHLPSPFTVTNHYSAKSLGLNHPDALAVGPDGNLYVTDLSQRVSVISPAGKVLRRWGKPGSGPGEFKFIASDANAPTDVAGKIATGPNGTVYVSDSGNARVQEFTPQGAFIRQFGSYGTGKTQFLGPSDLVVDKAGDVYVEDGQAETVTKFSSAGKLIWRIGATLGAPDIVGHHHFTVIDAHGRIVMTNDDLNKVVYVDTSGHELDSFRPESAAFYGGNVCEATVDSAGNTYVSGCGPGPTGPTLVYDRAHRLIAKWPGTAYTLLRSPVFGPHGEVFALATDGSILKLHITLPGG